MTPFLLIPTALTANVTSWSQHSNKYQEVSRDKNGRSRSIPIDIRRQEWKQFPPSSVKFFMTKFELKRLIDYADRDGYRYTDGYRKEIMELQPCLAWPVS